MGLASTPLLQALTTTTTTTTTTIRRSCFSSRKPLVSRFTSSGLRFSKICSINSKRSSLSFIKDAACRVSCSQVKVEDSINDEACELVDGVELSLGEGVDSINAYLFKAVKNNNGTGILLLSDIFGFEDSSTRDFAYRVACNGYNVLVPDLFRGDPWVKDQPKTLFEPWLARQYQERVEKDIDTSVKWMMDEFVAAGVSKKLGIMGFSFGGDKVLDVLARDQSACFGIGVIFYGRRRIEPLVVPAVKVPVLFIAGDNDPLSPVNALQEVEKKIEGSQVVIFKGRGHGFVHRPESSEEDGDAEQAFMVMRNWLNNGLVLNN